MTTPLELQFQAELLQKSETAKRACGYNPTRFVQMLSRYGGVQTAKTLLRKHTISDGFTTLQLAGRLDLSMEATVVDGKYASLFTDDEVNHCYTLLCECGFYEGK